MGKITEFKPGKTANINDTLEAIKKSLYEYHSIDIAYKVCMSLEWDILVNDKLTIAKIKPIVEHDSSGTYLLYLTMNLGGVSTIVSSVIVVESIKEEDYTEVMNRFLGSIALALNRIEDEIKITIYEFTLKMRKQR